MANKVMVNKNMGKSDRIFGIVQELICQILDVTEEEVQKDTYLIEQLNMESIDMLELAVSLNKALDTSVDDNKIFLKDLREYLSQGSDQEKILQKHYPHLDEKRIQNILEEIKQGRKAVLQVQDLVSYLEWEHHNEHTK